MNEYDDDLPLDLATARAQLALHRLARNPDGVELWLLVEELREQRLREEVRHEFFNDVRDRRSTLLIEMEQEGLRLRDEAIRLRRLGLVAEAEKIETKADELWAQYDDLEARERDSDGAWRTPRPRERKRARKQK